MSSCCLAYIQHGRIIRCFCLNGSDYQYNFRGFLIHKIELSFKNLTCFLSYFYYYLPFAFVIYLRLESPFIWGQLIALSAFSGYQYSDPPSFFGLFWLLPDLFNYINFCRILFLLVTVVQISPFFRSDLGR